MKMGVCYPACDMVPGQRVKQWQSRIGDSYLAFKAVKLESVPIKDANKNANRNEYLFLNDGDTPFSLFSRKGQYRMGHFFCKWPRNR